MNIKIHDERLISVAPPGIKDWGPWQFPTLYKNNDILYLEFHQANDSAKDYGKEKKKYISYDLGKTFKETKEIGGIETDDSTIIVPYTKRPFKVDEITLPDYIHQTKNYGLDYYMYPYDLVDNKYKKWFMNVKKDNHWNIENIKVDANGLLMTNTQGVFPSPFFWQLTKAPDGSIFAPMYKIMHNNLVANKYCSAIYFKSTDNGKTFKIFSTIDYNPPYDKDSLSELRYGFTEPNICFVTNKKAYTLLRTTDGNGIGPIYISWSNDGGKTWDLPKYFDDKGVWPQSIMLNNNCSIAAYGRTGLHIKIYSDNNWSKRYDIVIPAKYQQDTCSYCAIQPISDNKALIVYSRFNYSYNSSLRKVIMCREIEVEV